MGGRPPGIETIMSVYSIYGADKKLNKSVS